MFFVLIENWLWLLP